MKSFHRLFRLRTWSLLLASCLLVLSGSAADRVALVVGIDNYSHAQPLQNAVSDARLVTRVLKETGFDVVSLENPGVDSFYEGLDHLKRRSGLAKVGIVYFAGHGVEVEGENYLLPVDAELERSIQLRSQAIALETILEDLSEARLEAKVVILDCCRDNPLKRGWMNTRSVGRGLAPILDVSMPEASLVVYSAGPGQVALDGEGGNSPFTEALARRLRQPGQNLLQAFLKTSDDVVDVTGGRQEPWVKMDAAGRAMRELVLVPETEKPKPSGASPATVAAAPKPPAPTTPSTNPPVASASPEVGNGAPAEPLKKEENGQVMKETPAPETTAGEPTPTIGNQPEETPAVETKPLELPTRGYFSNSEVFEGGPYSGYNSYAKNKILRSAQGKLSGAGTPDGVMGRKTQGALVSYQEANNLPVTGVFDTATLTKMGLAGLPEETYTAPKKTYTKSKTYSSSSSPSRSSGSSSQSSGNSGSNTASNSGSSQKKSSGLPRPNFPQPGFPPAPGFPPMMKPPSPMKSGSSNANKNNSGGGIYKPPSGKTRMGHAQKKWARPG